MKKYKYNTKARKYYKSDTTYIQAIYRNNKALIDAKNEGIPLSSYQVFKQDVKDYMEVNDISASKAVGKVLRSRKYLSVAELSKQNLISGLKSKGLYKQFRELTKEKGRYTKFDVEKLQYKGDGVYQYDKVYIYTLDSYTTGDTSLRLELH